MSDPLVPAPPTQPASQAKTIAALLLFAGGLGYGATRFGVVALGASDDQPTEMTPQLAVDQPINRWVTVKGVMDPSTMLKNGHLDGDAVAFRLRDGGKLILVTDTQQHPLFKDPKLWEPGIFDRLVAKDKAEPAGLPERETIEFLFAEQSFTGTISQPGLGMDDSTEVSVRDHAMKITGFAGFCSNLRDCGETPIVLLVGETPKSRVFALAATIGLALISLVMVISAVTMMRKAKP